MATEGEDEQRFRALFDACAPDVLRYAARRVAVPADAADIVTEVFLVAWRRLDDVPDDGTSRLWLFGVARRVLANHRRGEQRRDELTARLSGILEERFVELDHPALGEPGRSVAAALAQLAAADRELLRLAAWEQLTPAEIAVVLELPVGTVRVRLHRARNRMRDALAQGDRPGRGIERKRTAPAGHVQSGDAIAPLSRQEQP